MYNVYNNKIGYDVRDYSRVAFIFASTRRTGMLICTAIIRAVQRDFPAGLS